MFIGINLIKLILKHFIDQNKIIHHSISSKTKKPGTPLLEFPGFHFSIKFTQILPLYHLITVYAAEKTSACADSFF